jgi:hypothetical protein
MSSEVAMQRFKLKMEKALENVKMVLHANRRPQLASEVHHVYDDKYTLTEALISAAMASEVTNFFELGLSSEMLKQLCSWAQTKEVTLEFRSSEKCSFNRQTSKEVDSGTKHVTEVEIGGFPTETYTSKGVRTVKEWFWDFEMEYKLVAYPGTGESGELVVLQQRVGKQEIQTTSDHQPRPSSTSEAHNVSLSWLLRNFDVETLTPKFTIDRDHKACATPRRNADVEMALGNFSKLRAFCKAVLHDLQCMLKIASVENLIPRAVFDSSSVFVPVLPLLEDSSSQPGSAEESQPSSPGSQPSSAAASWIQLGSAAEPQPSPPEGMTRIVVHSDHSLSDVLADVNCYLSHERTCLKKKYEELRSSFPIDLPNDSLFSPAEGIIVVTLLHLSAVCEQLAQAVDYIEGMIRQQLIAAIGKEVMPADFAAYMRFHNQKLFLEPFAPRPFCYSVRRSDDHGPEGTLSIEEDQTVGSMVEPIPTLVHHRSDALPMRFSISASVNVTFGGDRYLHATCLHKFSGKKDDLKDPKLQLVSRAR